MLIAKLENQREFTQIAYLGGENVELSCWFGGLRSWIDTGTNAATAAENKPVYSFLIDVCKKKNEVSQIL
jgi:hypothetical protein